MLHAVLDAGLVAHVGVLPAGDPGQPYVLPCGYARDGETLLLHGSTGSRLFQTLSAGSPACVAVTLLDGVVYARSAFNSSMNYRSVMVLGAGAAVPPEHTLPALRVLSDHLLPGRWEQARPPSRRELAATLVVAIPLSEASVKVSAGPPEDDAADLAWPAWAGVLPLRLTARPPEPAPGLPAGLPVPGYVTARFPTGGRG